MNDQTEASLRKLKEIEDSIESSPVELPNFFGFTIDKGLRQFRKVCRGENQRIEFFDFDSDEGQELLALMRNYFSFLFESGGG